MDSQNVGSLCLFCIAFSICELVSWNALQRALCLDAKVNRLVFSMIGFYPNG